MIIQKCGAIDAVLSVDVDIYGNITRFIVVIRNNKHVAVTITSRGWRYRWILDRSAIIDVRGFHEATTQYEISS